MRLRGIATGNPTEVIVGWEALISAAGKPRLERAKPRLPAHLDFNVPDEVLRTIAGVQGELPVDKIILARKEDRVAFRTDSRFRGQEVDLVISPDETLLEKEVELQFADLPSSVKRAILSEMNGRRIDELLAMLVVWYDHGGRLRYPLRHHSSWRVHVPTQRRTGRCARSWKSPL